MEQEVLLKYYNPALQIGLCSWREVYLLCGTPEKLVIETWRGNLVYRVKGSSHRYSYKAIKTGLQTKRIRIFIEVDDLLPF